MSIDDTFAETWRDAEEYFEDQGFEGTKFEIEAFGRGDSLEEAAESTSESTSGTMRFEKEETELVFTYNPMTQDGDLKVERYSSGTEADIERYVDELEEILEADIEYSLG